MRHLKSTQKVGKIREEICDIIDDSGELRSIAIHHYCVISVRCH